MADPTFDQAWTKIKADKAIEVGIPDTPSGVASRPDGTKFAVSLSDLHVPHHDKKVLAQIYKYLEHARPDVVIVNGDLVDFYSISSFLKDPSRKETLQEEIDEAVDILRKLRELCPEVHYNMGNHEDRLRRYLLGNAKALTCLRDLQFESLFKLEELDVQYHDTAGFRLNRDLVVTHGARVSRHAGATARMEFDRHLMSGMSGHTHRVGRYDVTGLGGDFSWVEQGCLCDTNPEYVTGKPNWQQGFGIIYYRSRWFDMREIRIHNRRLVVDGVDYSA